MELRTHRLVSSPGYVTSACGTDLPGDTLAANPSPLTCPECQKLETATPRQLRDSANRPWGGKNDGEVGSQCDHRREEDVNHLFIGPAWNDLPPEPPKVACGLRADRLPAGDTVTRTEDGVTILVRPSKDCQKCVDSVVVRR